VIQTSAFCHELLHPIGLADHPVIIAQILSPQMAASSADSRFLKPLSFRMLD
jgi:hypothetical protein